MLASSIVYKKQAIFGLFNDPEYRGELLHFAAPIALQQLVMSSLNMVSVIFIGQLGGTALAAVGLAAQLFFLLQLVLSGMYSGAAMFTAQFWGKGDVQNLRKVHAMALSVGLAIASAFTLAAFFAPEFVFSIFSRDPAVIALGGAYLRIFGLSFPLSAVTFCYSSVLRSTGHVKMPVVVGTAALFLNALLSYLLIFGIGGFPELGVAGAAVSALVSRALETGVILALIYSRRLPADLRLADFRKLSFRFVLNVFKPVLPVILNETFYSLGITAYFVIYARISTDSVAAMNIVASIESLAFVFMQGIAAASAIMIGNRIGAKKVQQAFNFGISSLATNVGLGIAIGLLITLFSPYILHLYKVSPIVIGYTRQALIVLACLTWVRSATVLIIIGILRSGGDTQFSFLLDGIFIWVFGVPLAYIAAFVLKLPVYWVYLAVNAEELIKFVIGTWRIVSKKWIHDMTERV